MGQAKNQGIEFEEKCSIASNLCIDIGAIEECEHHEGEYSLTLQYLDVDEAFSEIIDNNPDSIKNFSNQEEMKECIAHALEISDECSYCGRWSN